MRTKFRGITVREGALIQGPAGGGVLPVRGVRAADAARWLASAIESATVPWPEPLRTRIPVNVTVPAVGPERAREIVAASGCLTAKVKVAEPGQAGAEDINRVAAVRDALGPAGRIRVDANGGWDVSTATRMLRALCQYSLEYAEQPCATLEELAELRRFIDIPVAADESIRKADDPLRVRRPARRHRHGQGAAAGRSPVRAGRRGSLRLPVVVSSAVDTWSAWPPGWRSPPPCRSSPYACGLAHHVPARPADVTAAPLAPESRGELPVRRPAVDVGQLARWGKSPGPLAGPGRCRGPVPSGNAACRGSVRPVNPSTAFAAALADELARCGLREVVIAPGSRSAPLAMAFWALERAGRIRLHVRINGASRGSPRSASPRRPAAASRGGVHLGHRGGEAHPAVIEADESAVPLLLLTANRPPDCAAPAPARR